MVIERQPAKKVYISDLLAGKWTKMEGMQPSYIETQDGEKISRARILGTVVQKFISEDNKFGSITLDDMTETIRVKVFKTMKPIENINIGDIVDVIGKVKEFDDEIYIIPEVIQKITNPNFEILRRAELLKKAAITEKTEQPEEKVLKDKEELRVAILKAIESKKDGAMFDDIIKAVDAKEEKIEEIIDELLSEGICYEPSPGKIKKI
jgi:RPA family protein